MRWITAVFALAVSVATFAAEPFARAEWVADFEQLKAALTTSYPNLEWAAQRGMDLPALERRARERLDAATDEAAARRALERFIAGFGDGHLQLTWAVAGESASPAAPEPPLCTRLGYASRPDTRAIARDMPGYRSLLTRGANVAAGVFESGGKKIGVLRIAEFSPDLSLCEHAVRELEVGARPACTGSCEQVVEKRTEALLVESIEASLRAVVAEKPELLLVDVAANGGGNDSAIVTARMVTAAPLPSPRITFVRSAARAQDLREDAAELKKIRGPARKLIALLIPRIEAASLDAGKTCDLAPLWLGKGVACSNLLSTEFFAGGLIDGEWPDALRGQAVPEVVSSTARYTYTPALWTGPLVILVDGNSASATELFTVMLQDAGRALVVGSPTFGAGCGWTLPRVATELANSHGQLFMPDCARLRPDGSNELDGIQPQLLIGFRTFDSPAQRVRRFTAALPEILSR